MNKPLFSVKKENIFENSGKEVRKYLFIFYEKIKQDFRELSLFLLIFSVFEHYDPDIVLKIPKKDISVLYSGTTWTPQIIKISKNFQSDTNLFRVWEEINDRIGFDKI